MPSRNSRGGVFVSRQESSPHEAPRPSSSRSSLVAGCAPRSRRHPCFRRAGVPGRRPRHLRRPTAPSAAPAVDRSIANAVRRHAGDRPPRPRLDAEHRPHRVLRRPSRGLVPRRRHRPPGPAVRAPRRRRRSWPAHQAECGISFQDSLTFAVAAGADIVSVAAILQKTASAIGVLASGPIQRPRDLDGKTYAGFGYPNEVPTLKAVIQADGGKGDFKVATLDTAAYEALYAEARGLHDPVHGVGGRRGVACAASTCATSSSRDYGFPEFYQVVLACDRQWLERDPDAARRFVAATVRGFQFAADHAARGGGMLVSENPGVFDANPDLPRGQPGVPRRGRVSRRRDRPGVGKPDARALDGVLEVPVRPAPPDGRGREADDGRARLRPAVHERLPAVISDAGGARRRQLGPPAFLVAALLVVLGALCPCVGRQPVRPAGARARSSAALWEFRARRSATAFRRSSRPRSASACRSSRPSRSRSSWTGSSGSRRAVEPLLVGSQTIPIVAIAPLVVVWFGFGIAAEGARRDPRHVLPDHVALLDGFASTPAEATELLRSFGASAGPDVLQGPLAVGPAGPSSRGSGSRRRTRSIAAVIAEYVGATEGLGIWMQLSQRSFRTDLVFAAIVLTAVLSIALYARGRRSPSGRSSRGHAASRGARQPERASGAG